MESQNMMEKIEKEFSRSIFSSVRWEILSDNFSFQHSMQIKIHLFGLIVLGILIKPKNILH